MKYSIGILSTVTLIAAFILSACDSPPDRMERADTSVIEENRDQMIDNNELESELREYREENADRIMEHNRTIAEIDQRINNESDEEVRDSLRIKLDRYEENNRELKREMDNYRVSGKENWDDFKDGFSKRMDDLGDSLNNFFSTSGTTTTAN